MKKVVLLLITALAGIAGIAQLPLKNAHRKSWFVNIYRIPADTAQRYITKGIPSVDHYLQQQPVAIYRRDSITYEKLPLGNYIAIVADGDELAVDCFSRSDIDPFVVNNEQRPQLLLRNKKDQQPISGANVFIDGKVASYNNKAGTYSARKRNVNDDIVKIIVPGDTSFYELSVLSKPWRSPAKQRWLRFKGTKVGSVITWLPDKIRYFIRNKPRYWFRKRYKRTKGFAKGYMLFSKPKYFPVDTVRFKAYIVNKKGKPYRKSLPVYLEYKGHGRYVSKQLAVLKPMSDGAYVYSFPTTDTMPNDTRYNIAFKGSKNRTLLTDDFRIEDYLLDEVASYDLSVDKHEYLPGDTFHITASAKDANGLPVMDGRVNIFLLTQKVSVFNRTREFVPDTLWTGEKSLAVDGDTKFDIPSSMLPQVNADISVVAVFRNSNNEMEEERREVRFSSGSDFILVTEEGRDITAVYYEKGIAKPMKGWMETDISDSAIAIGFPFTAQIDPMAGSYKFFTNDNKGQWKIGYKHEVEENYDVRFIRAQHGDTAGFILSNPYRIPVYYSLLEQNKEILKASSTDAMISWKDKLPPGKLFTLKWQYYWGGNEKHQSEGVGLLHKLMNSEISSATAVYPGQKDTVTIAVKDYRDKKVPGVNLTVAGYNTQFGKDLSVPEPPYIDKFRGRSPVIFNKYEIDEPGRHNVLPLGKHTGWLQPLGLDTMAYYRFLFPGKNYRMVRTQIGSTLIPQVSVYATQKGKAQEIYLLYLNRELVYYNATNTYKPYAFSVYPGFAQIAFRLRNKYVEIDSIYMQPFYKHDISFDLDSLPANAKVTPMPDTWTWDEKTLLERSILRVENNGRNNNGYIWQGDRVELLAEYSRDHWAGPFRVNDSIQFFKQYDFDFRFNYEAGYTYRITPQMVRLEKKPLFYNSNKIFLPGVGHTKWRLGDTLLPPPAIRYNMNAGPTLEQVGSNGYNNILYSRIMIELPKDTVIAYTILHQQDTAKEYRVLWSGVHNIYEVKPGTYSVVIVTRNNRYIVADDIVVTTKGTYCVDMRNTRFDFKNEFAEKLYAMQRENQRIAAEAWQRVRLQEQREQNTYIGPRLNMRDGNNMISGVVRDEKGGDVIVNVTVFVKGYNTATVTNAEGRFTLQGISNGRYVLVFSSVGYESHEMEVTMSDGEAMDVAVVLRQSEQHLSEVVVVGYGTVRKREIVGSIATISSKNINLTQSLQGKVAGVYINNAVPGANDSIRIRGAGSINGSNDPLYVVDGVPMDKLPEGWDPSQVAAMETVKDATALAIWGDRAANGVIIITTKGFSPNPIRKDFKDYAIWQPNLITDKNGEVKFAVIYPDNITSWQTWVVGMDRKRRITKASKLVKAFKPLLGQLSAPQFLIAGDSVTLIGKKINYTASDMTTAVSFTVNDNQVYEANETIAKNNSSINELRIQAGDDSITARFQVKANGFADGEERKIPVLRRGTMETKGMFYVLEKDTSVAFSADPLAGKITLLAQNNTFDLLLDEISQLHKYPYYCMEQVASKLTGMAMEKKIRNALGQPFKKEKPMRSLISKLQKGQRFDGGWAWWQEGETNPYITNYITRALVEMNDNPLLQTNIRNALLYLQNQLPYMGQHTLLESLYTLSEAKHEMDYYVHLRKMPFDSLPQHQQWQIVSILQHQKLSYEKELNKLMAKKTATMLGGLHWGESNYYWERNAIATTVIAYKVLVRDGNYNSETQKITQYFLEMKRGGYWRNTVEAATILSAIVPQKLKENKNFTQPASLTIGGDTSLSVTTFPFVTTLGGEKQRLFIQKSGGGMVYFTAWQEIFNPNPTIVDSLFRIKSYFKNAYDKISVLKAGEKVMLRVEVEAMSDADYVQLEIPVPAGCTYAQKTNDRYGVHREYFKDRVVLFIEKMRKGHHEYEIELEPRYTGKFTINPAKAELMYFPTFYGRNEMKSVGIY